MRDKLIQAINSFFGVDSMYYGFEASALADGTKIMFDAASDRFDDYFDGSYSVTGANIEKWLNFTRPVPRYMSYARRDEFK